MNVPLFLIFLKSIYPKELLKPEVFNVVGEG